ncbi:hypothetical protein INS49_001443 [Diaporthe citri]|uniref:uncharacterized protein n=1 Tax=Diaporthe citri TaxID=83186 RepID=UPI001C808BF1|nr:uncharacterized protein INS49_001443 [Diaporthe citri]KAG6367256.1 hypothetical protein INS49_001443 [Diaporthe citri]
MKVFFYIYTLVAAVAATAMATTSERNPRPFNTTLRANATEILAANGIWAPNVAAFAAGDFNVDGVNFTAEEEKFSRSGLDINDLVQVRIDSSALMATVVGDGGGGGIVGSEKGQCDDCATICEQQDFCDPCCEPPSCG